MNEQEAIKAIRLDGIQMEGKAVRMLEFYEGLVMAEEALERQVPKKVNKETKDSYGNVIPRCPSCSKMFVEDYCSKCGQKIDWTVEE